MPAKQKDTDQDTESKPIILNHKGMDVIITYSPDGIIQIQTDFSSCEAIQVVCNSPHPFQIKAKNVRVDTTNNRTDIYGQEIGSPLPASKTTQDHKEYQIGDILPDRWIIMGMSIDTGLVFSCEPSETALQSPVLWEIGNRHAQKLSDKGNINARQPSLNELQTIWKNVVYNGNNVHAKFNPYYLGPHLSSTLDKNTSDHVHVMHIQKSSKESCSTHTNTANGLIRVVRDEPNIHLENTHLTIHHSP